MRPPIPYPRPWRLLLALLALTALPTAKAAPSGFTLQSGAAEISQQGAVTVINQTSAQLILHWENFDLAAGERVEIIQPQADSLILLNVVAASPTAIAGGLSANGRVVLANPAGIEFGADAQLTASGLWAAALPVDEPALLGGILSAVPDATGATLTNAGQLGAAAGGSVVLWGNRVENSGAVTAEFGQLALLAAQGAQIGVDEAGKLAVEVTVGPAGDEELPALSNSGTLHAKLGQVALLAAPGGNQVDEYREVPVAVDAGDVVNSGVIDVAAARPDSEPAPYNFSGLRGEILVSGRSIEHRGLMAADLYGLGTPQITPPDDWPPDEEYTFDRWEVIERALSERSLVVLAATDQLSLRASAMIRANGSAERSDVRENRHHGGELRLLGATIELADQARLEAIGLNIVPSVKFGEINVGGPGTHTVTVGRQTWIDAGGAAGFEEPYTEAGDPGTISLYAQDHIVADGVLSARPGNDEYARRGGTISLHSDGLLTFRGAVQASANVSSSDYLRTGTPGLVRLTADELILAGPDSEIGIDSTRIGRGLQYFELLGNSVVRADAGSAPVLITGSQTTIRAGTLAGAGGEIDLRGLTFTVDDGSFDGANAFAVDLEAGGTVVVPAPLNNTERTGWRGAVRLVSRAGDIVFPPGIYSSDRGLEVAAAGKVVFEMGASLQSGIGSPTGAISAGEAIEIEVVPNEWGVSESGPLSLTAPRVSLRTPAGAAGIDIHADRALLSGAGDISLALRVSGDTHIDSAPGGQWQVTGRTARVGASLPAGAFLRLQNSADLRLNDITLTDATAELSAPGRLLSQYFDRKLRSTRSHLHLEADRLIFGANATSRVEMRGGGNLLTGRFGEKLEFNGPVLSDSADDLYRFHGDEGANRLLILDTAELRSMDSFFGDVRLGGGNDSVRIFAPGAYRLYLGEGIDEVLAHSSLIHIWAVDFEEGVDSIVFRPR